jgi:hypothetical protein
LQAESTFPEMSIPVDNEYTMRGQSRGLVCDQLWKKTNVGLLVISPICC